MKGTYTPSGCYPACVCQPRAVTLRNDSDLIELVGDLCGNDVRDVLERRLKTCVLPEKEGRLADLLSRICDAAHEIELEASTIQSACDSIESEFIDQ